MFIYWRPIKRRRIRHRLQTRPTPLLGRIYCRRLNMRRSATGRTAACRVGIRRRHAYCPYSDFSYSLYSLVHSIDMLNISVRNRPTDTWDVVSSATSCNKEPGKMRTVSLFAYWNTRLTDWLKETCFVTFVLFQGKSLRVPWLSLAKSLPLYALAVANITFDWGFYTLLSCLPQYFRDILHFDIETVSWCVHFGCI